MKLGFTQWAFYALVASFICISALAAAQTRKPDMQEGLCRRAPTALALAPEPVRIEQSRAPSGPYLRVPPPDLSAPPTPTPVPSAASEEEEAIVVTGTRLARRDFESISPVTSLSSETEPEAAAGSAFVYRNRQPAPEPGLLTAGDHDDLLNPDLYAAYADAFLQNEGLEGVPRVDTRNALTIAVENRAGRPIPFAEVTLTCADGNQLTLTTTADGTAVFFPELDRLGPRVSAAISHNGDITEAARSISLTRRPAPHHPHRRRRGAGARIRSRARRRHHRQHVGRTRLSESRAAFDRR